MKKKVEKFCRINDEKLEKDIRELQEYVGDPGRESEGRKRSAEVQKNETAGSRCPFDDP